MAEWEKYARWAARHPGQTALIAAGVLLVAGGAAYVLASNLVRGVGIYTVIHVSHTPLVCGQGWKWRIVGRGARRRRQAQRQKVSMRVQASGNATGGGATEGSAEREKAAKVRRGSVSLAPEEESTTLKELAEALRASGLSDVVEEDIAALQRDFKMHCRPSKTGSGKQVLNREAFVRVRVREKSNEG